MTSKTRALVLFADQVLSCNYAQEKSILEQTQHNNLDQIASLGCTAKLHVRTTTQQHVAQLLGIFETKPQEQQESQIEQPLNKMNVFVWSNQTQVQTLCQQNHHSRFATFADDSLPNAQQVAQKLSEHDLVLLHRNGMDNAAACISYMDELVQHFAQDASIYLVIVASFAHVPDSNEKPAVPTFVPPQSYCLLHNQIVPHVRHQFPMVAVYHQDKVTRKDKNTQFTEASCLMHAGMGSLLADRFLFEIAYKLGFTPKYGA